MTDPRADPHGATPGSPFSPAGSPAGAPGAGAVTSGWPGQATSAVPPAVPQPARAVDGHPSGGARPGVRQAGTTRARPRTPAEEPGAVTGTFDPPGRPMRPPPRGASSAASTAPSATPGAYATPNVAPARRRPAGSRKARLRLTRIDPWSALKTSLVFSGFLFIVWMVAVIVLFLVLTVAGTFDSINSTLSDVLGTHVDFNGGVIIGIALVVGALSVVLVSALGTVMAFAYNVTASLIGGVDVTLTESDS